MIMIESERITENVRSWLTDVISAVTSALPADKIMFSTKDPKRVYELEEWSVPLRELGFAEFADLHVLDFS